MNVIAVTGSVGAGKTTLAKKLAREIGYDYIDVNRLIAENNLSSGYDRKRKCKIVDVKKLNKFLINNLIRKSEKGLVIDSHLSHYLPKRYVGLCIVAKCRPDKLKKRLKKRKYSKEKIKENLECEIFDICLNEAIGMKHNVLIVDSGKWGNLQGIIQNVCKQIKILG